MKKLLTLIFLYLAITGMLMGQDSPNNDVQSIKNSFIDSNFCNVNHHQIIYKDKD